MNYLITQQEHYGGQVIDLSSVLVKVIMGFDYIYCIHDDPKETDRHFHAILVNCKKSKLDLLVDFPTADILPLNAEPKFQLNYLMHNTKRSQHKIKYDISKVIHSVDLDLFVNNAITYKQTAEICILNEICDKIINHEIVSYYQCVRMYKGYALKNSRAIQDFIESMSG